MIAIGLDLGTKTIVSARRDAEGKPFFEFKDLDAFTKKLLVNQKIPFVERGGKCFALGRKAEQFAYAVNAVLRRPMKDGTVSNENEAISIMASIVHAIIGKLEEDAILYYCIPADAINKSTNVKMHQKIAQMIIDGYTRTSVKVRGFPINEARALAIGSEQGAVIAISWGAGMVNVCYSLFGMTIYQFSIVGSGDWVDVEAAKQFGFDPENENKPSAETPTSICKRKHDIDLSKPIAEASRVDQAIMFAYQVLIENVVTGIIQGFRDNIDRGKIDNAIPIIMAGGTSMPPGFCAYFDKILRSKALPFEVSDITVHQRPLFAVAEGCLMAAEMHEPDA